SRMVLMLGITVVTAVSGVLAPPLGFLFDRFSVRVLMLTGAIMLGVGYAAISLVTSFGQVLLIYGLLIAPANVMMGPTAVTVLLSRWFVRRRGTALGIAIAGISMGGVIFPPFIQWLLDSFHWRDALRLFAIILSTVLLSAALLVVNAPSDRGLHADGAREESEFVRAEARASLGSAGEVLRDPSFWMIAMLFAILAAGMIGMVTNIVPLMTDQGFRARDAAFLISTYSIFGFLSKLAFAAIADRLGLRRLTLLTFAGFALGMVCLSQAHFGYWVIAVGTCLLGLFGGLLVPLRSMMVPRVFGQKVVGRTLGMMSTISMGASVLMPPLFGLTFDLTGSYTMILAIFAGIAVLAMLSVPYIRMSERAPAPA
ncbi:MAG: MFS transporter, partial [Novosphingobium sp.]|nr:MFS transporter [Novosphingobium sp.]